MTSKFERKYGKYAIKNLSTYLIAAYIIGYAIKLLNSDISAFLSFDPYWIFKGQIWRIVTWILMPPEEFGIFTIIMLLLYYQLGQGLERTWGTYRFNVYMFSGFLFTIVGAFVLYGLLMLLYYVNLLPTDAINSMILYGITNPGEYFGLIISLCVSTVYINMSIFLAYAATYPEEQLLLYFIIPIKIKWFGYLYGAYILFDIVQAFKSNTKIVAIIITVLIVLSLLNFMIYWITGRHGAKINPKQVKRRYEYKQSIRQAKPEVNKSGARHKCVVCGRTELDNPDLMFRYCSKCSGNKEYCQDHLFTHTHN